MKKMIQMCRRIMELSKTHGELYIRGAGQTGRRLLGDLQELGIYVSAFLDRDAGRRVGGGNIPILSPDVIYEKQPGHFFVMIAVQDDDGYRKICEEMTEHGLKLGVDFGDFSIDADVRMMSFLDIRPQFDFYEMFKSVAEDRLHDMRAVEPRFDARVQTPYNLLPNLDVPLTTYCSLRCDFCSHCIPYANPPKHFKVEEILADMEKLLSVSYVACVAIMGGEPFLYPNLVDFIEGYSHLQNKHNIGFTRVVTNGTIVPPDDFFVAFQTLENSYIYISNYGEQSRKLKALQAKCEEFGVSSHVCAYSDQWVALGDFHHKRNYTDEQLRHLYAVCEAHSCVQLLNGRIYACARVPLLNEERLIPFSKADYCEIRDTNAAELKENLHKYLYETRYLEGCRYCDGQHIYSKKVGRGN